MDQITEIHNDNAISINMLCNALDISRATYYRKQHPDNEKTKSSDVRDRKPSNALRDEEQQQILHLLHSERFVDKTPYHVYYALLDEGKYYCSPRTMYRILESKGENIDRRNQRSHRDAVKPELISTQPNEVWSWDITKILSTKKFVYYHLYVILDIYSRYVVGWLIADCEAKELARKLIQKTALRQGIQPQQLVLHADNGPSMTSHTVAQLLEHLGILKTHNRPYTSNDNPFSESQFKTMKYCPEFPKRFESLKEAEKFCKRFFAWYNNEHYHSGILWLTPESVHHKKADVILNKRHKALTKAYNENPARFNHKAPKLRALPEAVYINPPQTVLISALQGAVVMA